MFTSRHIEAAAQIGMLTRERDVVAACDEALRLLLAALSADAATLIGLDPTTHVRLPANTLGYEARTTLGMAGECTALGDTARLPGSISSGPGQPFPRGEAAALAVCEELIRPTPSQSLRVFLR